MAVVRTCEGAGCVGSERVNRVRVGMFAGAVKSEGFPYPSQGRLWGKAAVGCVTDDSHVSKARHITRYCTVISGE